jgi:hypothetical protein
MPATFSPFWLFAQKIRLVPVQLSRLDPVLTPSKNYKDSGVEVPSGCSSNEALPLSHY